MHILNSNMTSLHFAQFDSTGSERLLRSNVDRVRSTSGPKNSRQRGTREVSSPERYISASLPIISWLSVIKLAARGVVYSLADTSGGSR